VTLPLSLMTVSEVVPAVLGGTAATVASPEEMHGELKVTVTGAAVYSVPPVLTTVTLRLAVPPADSDLLDRLITPFWKVLPAPLPISRVVDEAPLLVLPLAPEEEVVPTVANELLLPPPQAVSAMEPANASRYPYLYIVFT